MMPAPTPARPAVATDQQHQRKLGLAIFRLLKSNASDARPVRDLAKAAMRDAGATRPKRSRPVDAIRAEVFGFTMRVEITKKRHGEQPIPNGSSDSLRYACNDLNSFRQWFAALLQRSGLSMLPPATVTVREFATFMTNGARHTPPDPWPESMFHRKEGGKP